MDQFLRTPPIFDTIIDNFASNISRIGGGSVKTGPNWLFLDDLRGPSFFSMDELHQTEICFSPLIEGLQKNKTYSIFTQIRPTCFI